MDSTLYVCILIVDNNQDTNIGNQEKQNGATEVPPSTEASLDQSGDEIVGQSSSHSIYYKSFLVSFSPSPSTRLDRSWGELRGPSSRFM